MSESRLGEQWFKFSERRPPLDTNILLSDGHEIVTAHYSEPEWVKTNPHYPGYFIGPCGFGGYEWEFELDQYAPTGLYWMPLPELPK